MFEKTLPFGELDLGCFFERLEDRNTLSELEVEEVVAVAVTTELVAAVEEDLGCKER
jgi:hypothetical protein